MARRIIIFVILVAAVVGLCILPLLATTVCIASGIGIFKIARSNDYNEYIARRAGRDNILPLGWAPPFLMFLTIMLLLVGYHSPIPGALKLFGWIFGIIGIQVGTICLAMRLFPGKQK